MISGNQFGYGIQILNGSSGNEILGNYIGTDATGLHALGNFFGIFLEDAPFTSIGGTTPGAGNVISGNTIDGIFAEENFSTGARPRQLADPGKLDRHRCHRRSRLLATAQTA